MSGFLSEMARTSRDRCEAARADRPLVEVRAAQRDAPPVRPLRLGSFDLIAEVKLASPSEGVLLNTTSATGAVRAQALAYAAGGAAALSVLTEPSRFAGSLTHVEAAASSVDRPVMRKDFLVDPYQVHEARAAGASGVLLILRILDEPTLQAMLDAAAECGLFVLLEAFDGEELDQASRCAAAGVLVGLNCRDLQSLSVIPARFDALVTRFPAGCVRVAESGLSTLADVGRVAQLGYDLALVGTALMGAEDPERRVHDMVMAGRAAKESTCASA